MEQRRVQWIDVARGMAILLVVLGHCIGNLTDPLNRYILSFHMPLFFFLSGMCAKEPMDGFGRYIKRKAKTLLVPQVTLGLIDCAFDIIFGERQILRLLSDFLGWFLLVLFYVVVLFYFLCKLDLNRKNVKYIVIIADVICIFIASFVGTTKFHLEIVPMALLFYLLGYFVKPLLANKCRNDNRIDGLWILALPVGVICSYWNVPVTMYTNEYGNFVWFIIGASCGITVVCKLAQALAENRMLAWLGQNSVIVYVLHFKLIKALHLIGKTIFPQLAECNYLYPAHWHYFLLCILILIPAVYVCNRWFGIFFGKEMGPRIDKKK